MANLQVKDGASADKYLKAAGAGTSGDPLIPAHAVDSLPADPFGANADAAVTTDTAGSISAKLRGIVTLLAARLPTLVSGRMPVDGSGVTQPVSAASLPLPSGAATAANQATANTSLASIDGKLPASPAAEHTAANSPHAARLSDGTVFYKATTPSDTQPVSATSLPLATNAATEATLAAVAQDGAAITGQSPEAGGSHVLGWLSSIRKAITDRLPAALAGGRLDINIGASGVTLPMSTADGQNAAIGATTDAATANTVIGRLKQLLSRWPAALGQTTSANSLPVVLPSDQTVPISGAVDTELTTGDLDSGAGTDTRAVVGLVLAASGGGQLAPGDTANGLDVDVTRLPALPAGTNNIGDVDVLTVPVDPFGANADAVIAAGAAGSISAKLRRATQGLEDLKTAIVLAASSARIGKVTIRNSADAADIDPLAEGTFTARIGEVQASPTANTVLDRLKALLTGTVLAAGTNIIGKVGIDQTTDGTTNAVNLVTSGGAGATVGTTSGAAVVTDANGTLQQYLRGLVKLWIAGLAAGENHIGEVGGKTTILSPTLTVSTSPAYTAGDNVGGKLTLSNAVRVSGGTGVLLSIQVVDTSNQKAAFDILIFDSDPTAATITDNAAFVFSTDISKLIRRISVAAADYVTINSIAIADLSPGGRALKAASGTSLYAVIVTSGTPTYAATTAITIRLGILQD